MTLPRFSLLNILLLATIVGLSIPYLSTFKRRETFDCSFDRIKLIIEAAEPGAIFLRRSGDNIFSDITYAIPPNSSVDLLQSVNAQMEKQATIDHWAIHGTGKESEAREMTQFSYKLTKGENQCSLRLIKVYRKKASEVDTGTGLDEVRFFLFVDQTP